MTLTEIENEIKAIDTALSKLVVEGSSSVIEYKIDNVTVKKGEWHKFLLERRDQLQQLLREYAEEYIGSVAHEITEFGDDRSDYLGENK